MDKSNSPPESISFRELSSILAANQKKTNSTDINKNEAIEEQTNFKQLLLDWSLLSAKVLHELEAKESYVTEGRSSQSLIALGALEAHLNMALQAKNASES